MDYNHDGAQSHIQEMDGKIHEFEFTCDACKDGFDSGHGVKFKGEDERFCNQCISSYKHFYFYELCGMKTWKIMEIDKFRIKL